MHSMAIMLMRMLCKFVSLM